MAPRDEQDDDDERSAADDPTAMWDDDALRKAGMADIAGQTDAREAAAPATSYGVRGDERKKVVVGQGRSAAGATGGTAQRPAGGMSWTVTIALATILGLAVYFLVRLLK